MTQCLILLLHSNPLKFNAVFSSIIPYTSDKDFISLLGLASLRGKETLLSFLNLGDNFPRMVSTSILPSVTNILMFIGKSQMDLSKDQLDMLVCNILPSIEMGSDSLRVLMNLMLSHPSRVAFIIHEAGLAEWIISQACDSKSPLDEKHILLVSMACLYLKFI
jgi:hypothetical protein